MTDAAKKIHIVMTGGGSGGHITPVLAVAHQLKLLQPDCEISYVSQTGDTLADVPAQDPNIDHVYTVQAGKLRRYHGAGWRQLLNLPTTGKNLRDAAYVAIGLGQSYRLLRRLRPDVIFTRGSFVSVPVGLAAGKLGIPYITHDSDAIPSLANRLIARQAALHAVALPKEIYTYPANKTVTTGIPISHEFRQRSAGEVAELKQKLGFDQQQRLVLVTGGGHGAQRLNDAVISVAADLLQKYSDLVIVHLSGRGQEAEVNKNYNDILSDTARSRVVVLGFVTNLYEYSAIADVVVTRAGGTTIAEFAVQAKACVVVPNPELTGGHQTKNAKVLADRQAVALVDETQPNHGAAELAERLQFLLDNPAEAAQLAAALHNLAQPDAAKRLAMLLLEQANLKQT